MFHTDTYIAKQLICGCHLTESGFSLKQRGKKHVLVPVKLILLILVLLHHFSEETNFPTQLLHLCLLLAAVRRSQEKKLLTQNRHNCITRLQELLCWYALLLPKLNITEPGVQDKQKILLL